MTKRRFWTGFAAFAFTAIAAAAIWWSLQHPFGTSWDESQYLNEAQIDAQRLQHGMLLRLGGRILIMSVGRPPAYRILALPVLGLTGFHTAIVRLVTLACFALSSLLVFWATRRIANSSGGGFAVLIFCLSPIVIAAGRWFSTEGPLYLAVAATMYCIFEIWFSGVNGKRLWIGLGLAVGLGFLAKASYIAILLPVLVIWLIAERRLNLHIPKLVSQWKAGLLACLIAGPWWILNIKPALSYTEYARGFVANSLGPPSFLTRVWWLGTVFQSLLGYGVSIVIAIVLIVALRQVMLTKKLRLTPRQKLALSACASAAIPIVLVQLTGTNQLLRHITPAMIPFAIAIGALAEWTGWAQESMSTAITAVLLSGQLAIVVVPVFFPNHREVSVGLPNGQYPWRVMALLDQWDWTPLWQIGRDCDVPSPKISYLGFGSAFDKEQLERPWIAAAGKTGLATIQYADLTWLWHYEEGPIQWQKVMTSADSSDFVVTAPGYKPLGDDDSHLDNQYNSEFAERLSRDPNFREPIRLEMGRFKPIPVLIFARKSLNCKFRSDNMSLSTLPQFLSHRGH